MKEATAPRADLTCPGCGYTSPWDDETEFCAICHRCEECCRCDSDGDEEEEEDEEE